MSYVTQLFKCLLRTRGTWQCARFSGPAAPRLRWAAGAGAGFHGGVGERSGLSREGAGESPPGMAGEGSEVADSSRNDASIYVNEVCMQMDQLMSRCEDHEDLLVLLVTHRGVMYLHNLVTAMRMLQAFAERDRERASKPDADDLFAGYAEVFGDKARSDVVGGGDCGLDLGGKGAAGSVDGGGDGDGSPMRSQGGRERVGSDDASGNEVGLGLMQEGGLDGLTETQRSIVKRAREEVLVHFENPANQHYLRCKQHSRAVAEAIVRDERYDLLLHDLYENRTKLDVESACHVIIALDALEHKYFRLYNGIMRHLLRLRMQDIEPGTASRTGKLLLKVCQCYVRAGFYDTPLYSKVCREIYGRPLERPTGEIDVETLVETLKLFAEVDFYDAVVFSGAAAHLTRLPLTPSDVSHVAIAYSAHKTYSKLHDDVLVWVARQVEERSGEFTTLELARCVHAFAGMRLYFRPAYDALVGRLIDNVERATRVYAETQLTIPQMAIIVDHLANFAAEAPGTRRLIGSVMAYLEEYIDDIDEKSAIHLAFAVCATSAQDLNPYLLSFLLRIIGSGTEWERHKCRVFAIWLCQVLRFPEVVVNIPKRCITAGMREWLLRHGNGARFASELQEIARILQQELGMEDISMGGSTSGDGAIDGLEAVDAVDAVSSIDVHIDGRWQKIVLNEMSCRNDASRPIGVDLVISNLLRSPGTLVHSINFQHWRSMTGPEKVQYLQELLHE
ncbi:SNARE protein, putative (SYN3) [Babesia caballi]|uniref:SNARE protein, putative (SYN3) n=1 Tax=Babesia caballi TaxID=5871 RepID=A0AAV4LW66_BABCB|nr:SNARE protein, putative (SYN3) [Babesia caballi]